MIVRIMLLSLCFLSLRANTVEVRLNQSLGLLNLPEEVLLHILGDAIVEKETFFDGTFEYPVVDKTVEAAHKLRLVCKAFNRLTKTALNDNEVFKRCRELRNKPLVTDSLSLFAMQLDIPRDRMIPFVSHYSSKASLNPHDEYFKHYRVMCEYGTQK